MKITDISSIASFVSSLPHDRITLLTGRNGSGKTTLLDALSGEITFNGSTSETMLNLAHATETGSVRTDCAYCKQSSYSFSTLTVAENIRFARSIDAVSGPASVGNPEIALNRLESLLDNCRSIRAGRLSGGEERILAVLCTCLLDRDLYLFDEPLAGIDPANAPIVAAAISSLVPMPTNPADGTRSLENLTPAQHQAGHRRTVIVVTHGKEQAALFMGATILPLEREHEK